MTSNVELRLIGAPAPDGEISLKDLATLASALQELSTRIGREVVNAPGPGRTKQFVEEFTQLRLRGIGTGSTVLDFGKGPTDQLDVSLAEQAEADEKFWDVIRAIKTNQRPAWATDLIAESAAKLVTALSTAAPRVAFSDSEHPPVKIETSRLHVDVWTSRPVHTDVQMEAHGRLEKVDLRSHEFRVRDDVGQAVDLKHVVDPLEAAQLVGQWVVAVGDGIMAGNRLTALDRASITSVTDPVDALIDDEVLTLDQILDTASGPHPVDGLDLTDDEFAAFLQAARG